MMVCRKVTLVPFLFLLQNVTANHRINDAIANEDGLQVLNGRFMYGPLDMVTLTGEKVCLGTNRISFPLKQTAPSVVYFPSPECRKSPAGIRSKACTVQLPVSHRRPAASENPTIRRK